MQTCLNPPPLDIQAGMANWRPPLGALLSSDEFRVEGRANGEASSVMAVGGQAGLCCLVGRVGWVQLWMQIVARLSVL